MFSACQKIKLAAGNAQSKFNVFLAAGLLHASTCFKLMPIHSMPVIPTTLARNLQTSHPSTYGGVHGDIRTG